MQVKVDDTIFYCHSSACGAKGDIIEYVSKKHNKSVSDSILYLKKLYSLKPPKEKQRFDYIYKDAEGKDKFRKVKTVYENKMKDHEWQHKNGDIWVSGAGGLKSVLFNLNKFKDYMEIIICEGEKDCQNLNGLGLEQLATTAPFGAGSWDDSLTECLEGIPIVYFCYDFGNEKYVQKHATEIKNVYPDTTIHIISVPGEKREDDITDFLDTLSSPEEKQTEFLKLIDQAREKLFEIGVKLETKKSKVFWENLVVKYIPEAKFFINPYVMRGGLTGLGGPKFSHKSFFLMQAALHLVCGVSPFLKGEVVEKAKVLLIQQEITEYMFRKRFENMLMSGRFKNEIPLESLGLITSTKKRYKLNIDRDFDKVKKLIEDTEPDVLFLDPFYTFHSLNQNSDKDMVIVIDKLLFLKEAYSIGVFFSHHFTLKRDLEDPAVQPEVMGRFKGSTSIVDPLDCVITLGRLRGQKNNPNLPLPWENYNQVEVNLRDGRKPDKFEIEFDQNTFLLNVSDIWTEIGRLITPGQITEILGSHEGSMTQTELIEHYKDTAAKTTVIRSLNKALKENLIKREKKGKIVIWSTEVKTKF